MNNLFKLFCFLLFNNFAYSLNGKGDASLLVNTTHGLVLGHFNEVGIREWKGIPYAQPPVGSLRWEYPIPPNSYNVNNNDIYIADFNAAGNLFN